MIQCGDWGTYCPPLIFPCPIILIISKVQQSGELRSIKYSATARTKLWLKKKKSIQPDAGKSKEVVETPSKKEAIIISLYLMIG